MAVRVQLPLGLNICLLLNSDIVSFAWKTDEGKTESIVLIIFRVWRCFNCRWVRMVGCAKKSHLGPVEIASFSMTHSCMLYQLDISAFCFYEPLLFQLWPLGNY